MNLTLGDPGETNTHSALAIGTSRIGSKRFPTKATPRATGLNRRSERDPATSVLPTHWLGVTRATAHSAALQAAGAVRTWSNQHRRAVHPWACPAHARHAQHTRTHPAERVRRLRVHQSAHPVRRDACVSGTGCSSRYLIVSRAPSFTSFFDAISSFFFLLSISFLFHFLF